MKKTFGGYTEAEIMEMARFTGFPAKFIKRQAVINPRQIKNIRSKMRYFERGQDSSPFAKGE